jgi:hypothetical protein
MKASVLISAALSILISSVAALPAPAANSVVSRNPGVEVLSDLNKKSLGKCLVRSSIYQDPCSLQIADVIMSDRRDCVEEGRFCVQMTNSCCGDMICHGFLLGHCMRVTEAQC